MKAAIFCMMVAFAAAISTDPVRAAVGSGDDRAAAGVADLTREARPDSAGLQRLAQRPRTAPTYLPPRSRTSRVPTYIPERTGYVRGYVRGRPQYRPAPVMSPAARRTLLRGRHVSTGVVRSDVRPLTQLPSVNNKPHPYTARPLRGKVQANF